MPNGKVKVTQDPDNPVTKEVLAENIVKISEGMTKLLASGLNRKAIVVLLKHSTGLGGGEINSVLDGLQQLRTNYCT